VGELGKGNGKVRVRDNVLHVNLLPYLAEAYRDPCSSHSLSVINPYLLPYILPRRNIAPQSTISPTECNLPSPNPQPQFFYTNAKKKNIPLSFVPVIGLVAPFYLHPTPLLNRPPSKL